MAYNNRMSMAGSQQPHNRRKKEDDNDALMRLVSCDALGSKILEKYISNTFTAR